MMKQALVYTLSLMIITASLGGCSWAGKTTGKAMNAVEQGAAEFEQGYQQERAPAERATKDQPKAQKQTDA
jgi:hypothetical protein